MNQKKLLKLLERSSVNFDNLKHFKQKILEYERFIVDLNRFRNFEKFRTSAVNHASKHGIVMPYDSVMLEIDGLAMPSYRGEGVPAALAHGASIDKFWLLLSTVAFETEKYEFRLIVIQEYRIEEGAITARFHVATFDTDRGLIAMPFVTETRASKGCYCFARNPLSIRPILDQLSELTPGTPGICGLAAAGCEPDDDSCKLGLQASRRVVETAITILAYINLPEHLFLRVKDTRTSLARTMVVSEAQLSAIANGGKVEPRLTMFDGKDYENSISIEPARWQKPRIFESNGKKCEVIVPSSLR